jgi:signal transduction histidine kinase
MLYERWHGRPVPREDSLAGMALAAGSAILAADPAVDGRAKLAADSPGVIGATLAVPILGTRGPSGVLCISRAPGDEPFDDADQALIGAFASRAELALGLAASRRESEELQLVEDRDHIAEQLRDQVISRLFAAGLSVQSVLPRVANPTVRETLTRHIDEVDAIIADIRAAVFSIRAASTS